MTIAPALLVRYWAIGTQVRLSSEKFLVIVIANYVCTDGLRRKSITSACRESSAP